GRYSTDFGSKRQSVVDGCAEAATQISAVGGRLRLDVDGHLRETGLIIDFDAKFGDVGKSADDRFHGGGKNVVAADNEHVVGAAEDAAFHAREISPAGAAIARDADKVAG